MLLVRPTVDESRPRVSRQGRDAGLVLGDDVRPAVRQRFAAYAVVISSRGLLATQYSGRTAVTGRWGMPGGGLDDHEPPASAVLREVAEETSQEIILGELVKVQTSHWVGRSPYGNIEDFHAVRLIYRASCPHPTEPVVLDQGGTDRSGSVGAARILAFGVVDPELAAAAIRAEVLLRTRSLIWKSWMA